ASALLAFAISGGVSAEFEKTKSYADGKFTDVSATEWYSAEVKSTYELGLMNGVSDSLFSPDGNVTVAEALTMASRAASIYKGEEIPEKDGEWYAKYVAYAKSTGIISADFTDNYDAPATRAQVASFFAKALPADYFTVKNDVINVPDVPSSKDYADEILMLYKAGIVMGSDSYGNFFPENNITRAEAAAIINRVALPENRLSRSLDKISEDDAYQLVIPTTYTNGADGITSGWVLDNRGGVPRVNISDAYGTLTDTSEKAGTAMIREFNKTETGLVDIKTGVRVSACDGAYIELQNTDGDSVYRLEAMNGEWKVKSPDGSYKTVYTAKDDEKTFSFHISADLDNGRSITAINGVNCGTHPLAVDGDKVNILNFRFATTDKSTTTVALEPLEMTVNYALFGSVEPSNDGIMPIWNGKNGASLEAKVATLSENSEASVRFNPVSGKVISEFSVILPEGESVRHEIKSGDKCVAAFSTDTKAFYVNDTVIYEDYYHNLWYRLRFELDTATGKMLVKLNGRKVKELDFAASATSVDNMRIVNNGKTGVKFTDFKVFREIYREDYVPAPVVPEGADDYIIGMNVCSLWQNGYHFGWSCISPYTDHELALGYYDEGNPETADWEIKYLVEHGIDFQAFCVFFGNLGGVQKLSGSGAGHLYDGFMNAKYSDLAKFCIIWEASSGGAPASMEEWKTHFVPYFIENFFKDERYMVIENQPVVCVFSPSMLPARIGGNAKCKEMFDYLEAEVNRIFGYDGVIFLACGTSSDALAEMGFDGCYAYSWSTAGSSADVNKNSMIVSGDQGAVYTVPTVSVGFNSVAWHGKRFPMMTYEDYRTTHEWVRDRYLDAYPKEEWQENFVMLSTWNEYGEGTYIMPTAGENGFGYIDVVREVYTKEKADSSINTVPSEEQRRRINRLYPQYRHILRKEGYVTEELDENNIEILKTIDYGTVEGLKVWG
ncbi:MAG: S-layer homology domain-containing protein, partial [Clostridia bacterium]|nr:S-layer homology domain-containing protein [Clostridia bacterium]